MCCILIYSWHISLVSLICNFFFVFHDIDIFEEQRIILLKVSQLGLSDITSRQDPDYMFLVGIPHKWCASFSIHHNRRPILFACPSFVNVSCDHLIWWFLPDSLWGYWFLIDSLMKRYIERGLEQRTSVLVLCPCGPAQWHLEVFWLPNVEAPWKG